MMVSTVGNNDVINVEESTLMTNDDNVNDGDDDQIMSITSNRLTNSTTAISISGTPTTTTRDVSHISNNNETAHDGMENEHEAERDDGDHDTNSSDAHLNPIVTEIDSTILSGLSTPDNDEAHDDNDNDDATKMCESDLKTPTPLSGFNKSIVSKNINTSNCNNNNKERSSKQISKQVSNALPSSAQSKTPMAVVEHINECTDPNALNYKHQVQYCDDETSMELKNRAQKIIEDPIHHHNHCHKNTTPGAFPVIPERTSDTVYGNPSNDGAYSIDSNPINDAYLATDDPARDELEEGMANRVTLVHAVPWTESSSSFTSNPRDKKSNPKQTIANRCKSKDVWIWSIISVLLCCIVVVATTCGTGNCRMNNNNNNVSNNNVNSDKMRNESSSYYAPVLNKDELLMAVDDYLSQTNMTALDEKYGTISDWDVSKIKDFSYVFSGRRNSKNRQFNADISKWNVSSATNMSQMFRQAGNFRGDISNWDVSNVVDMNGFMAEATFFNSNLSKWNTSQFRDVSDMFNWVSNFAGNGVQDWDVSSVRNASGMFKSCDSFNANLSKWDVSRVVDMSDLFAWTRRFVGIGIEQWNTSNTENMCGLFLNALSFDSNLSNWDVDKVHDMPYMFFGTPLFKGIGVESWNTSQIQTMLNMFNQAISFDANLSHWDISNVKDTAGMFSSATSFRGTGIEDWDTSRTESMSLILYLMYRYIPVTYIPLIECFCTTKYVS